MEFRGALRAELPLGRGPANRPASRFFGQARPHRHAGALNEPAVPIVAPHPRPSRCACSTRSTTAGSRSGSTPSVPAAGETARVAFVADNPGKWLDVQRIGRRTGPGDRVEVCALALERAGAQLEPLTQSSKTSGKAPARSSAIRPGPAAAAPRLAMQPDAPAQAASKAGMPCASRPAIDAGQHVARPGRREPGRRILVDRRAAVRRRDHRVRPLQHDDRAERRGRRRARSSFDLRQSLPASGTVERTRPRAASARSPRCRRDRAERAPPALPAKLVSASASSTSAAPAAERRLHQRPRRLARRRRPARPRPR